MSHQSSSMPEPKLAPIRRKKIKLIPLWFRSDHLIFNNWFRFGWYQTEDAAKAVIERKQHDPYYRKGQWQIGGDPRAKK